MTPFQALSMKLFNDVQEKVSGRTSCGQCQVHAHYDGRRRIECRKSDQSNGHAERKHHENRLKIVKWSTHNQEGDVTKILINVIHHTQYYQNGAANNPITDGPTIPKSDGWASVCLKAWCQGRKVSLCCISAIVFSLMHINVRTDISKTLLKIHCVDSLLLIVGVQSQMGITFIIRNCLHLLYIYFWLLLFYLQFFLCVMRSVDS